MHFQPADAASVIAFSTLVALVLVAVLVGTSWSGRVLGDRAHARRVTIRTGFGLVLWVGLFSAVVASGALAAKPFPRIPIAFAVILLSGVGYGLSPAGRRLAIGLPTAALVAFQAYRLPLELILHHWAEIGTIPTTMTWTGANFDIVAGTLALLLAPFAGKSRALAWTFNLVGSILLVNVARVAMMSMPVPFGWGVEPPLLVALHLPYALIAPVCVAAAVAGHVVLTRRLLLGKSSPTY